MADDGKQRRNGFVTWEPGSGRDRDDDRGRAPDRDGSQRSRRDRPDDGSAHGSLNAGHDGSERRSDGKRRAGDGFATSGPGRREKDRFASDLPDGDRFADGRGSPDRFGDGRDTGHRSGDGRGADGQIPGRRGRGRGHEQGAGPTAAASGDGRGNGLGVGLLDPLQPKRGALPQEPGDTMIASHRSSAPPDLGPVRASLDENKAILDAAMGVGTSFDIIYREFRFGDTRIASYVVNGMYSAISNMVLLNMLQWLTELDARRDDIPPAQTPAETLEALFQARIAYSQVTRTSNLSQLVFQVMSGPIAFLVDGADEAIIVDTREYPDRQPDEPDTERVIRGPHDGFIETLVYNTLLIRRRIRDPRLHFEIQQAGVRGQMDVAVGYIEGLTDPGLVSEVRERIHDIKLDGVPAAEQSISEYLTGHRWNPFPTVRFTERPDVAAFHLLEGHVVVLCDTTPQAIICPSTLWNHLQHAEDFHLNAFMGTYMRWVQYFGLLLATIVPPLWLAFAIDPRLVHALPGMAFLGPKQKSGFPLGLQFVGAELTLDLLRRAILNTPGTLSATMGILGAIVLGDVAAKAGIFSSEVLVYLVLAAIGQFAISSIELGMSARIVRFTLLIATWALRLPGLLAGSLVWLLVLLGTRTFGIPYTWPLIPFDWGAFRGMLVREPDHARGRLRPKMLRAQDRQRRPI
jgi:stage V sporulation protein AF